MKTYVIRVRDSEPMVGPFFWIGGKLFAHGEPISTAEEYGDAYNDTMGHNTFYYSKIAPQLGLSRYSDWEDFPRGRVVGKRLKDGRKRYYVYMDKCIIDNAEVIEKVLQEYHLPAQITSFRRDAHYKCSNCNGAMKEEEMWFDSLEKRH